jgi:hypothetical protein
MHLANTPFLLTSIFLTRQASACLHIFSQVIGDAQPQASLTLNDNNVVTCEGFSYDNSNTLHYNEGY